MTPAKKLISDTNQITSLQQQLKIKQDRIKRLSQALSDVNTVKDTKKTVRPVKALKGKAAKHIIRVIIPDSHGAHIDYDARDGFLRDLKTLKGSVQEVVWLGDHLDCAGTFSGFARSNTHELAESYADDVLAANDFIDRVQDLTPASVHHMMQGNHEFRVDRWAARNFTNLPDALIAIKALGYVGMLGLDRRGIRHYEQDTVYDSLSIPGTIRLGKVHFTHGFSYAKHAATVTLERVSDNVVFGHTHRAQSVIERTVARSAFGAWSVGCLSKLQPLYRHTNPTSWSHGYAIQFVNQSTGTFAHFSVPIVPGESLLRNVIDGIRK